MGLTRRKFYDLIDADKSGSISKLEIIAAVQAFLGVWWGWDELQSIFWIVEPKERVNI